MGRQGLWIGKVAARTGLSRKALRLYEAAGILAPSSRTASGYRLYDDTALAVLAFVARARRLGFSLDEIKEIVALKQTGQTPCPHVRRLVERRVTDLDRTIDELSALRSRLRSLLARWRTLAGEAAAVCPHIEYPAAEKRRNGDGAKDSLSVPSVRRVPRGRGPRRRGPDR